MVAVHYAGQIESLYPKVKVQSVNVTLTSLERVDKAKTDEDKVAVTRATSVRNKRPINGVEPGVIYYIPPNIFEKYRDADNKPLTTPFVKATPAHSSRASFVKEGDLCDAPIEDMNLANSSAFLLKHFYTDYIREVDVALAIRAAERIMDDFNPSVTERIKRAKKLIYVFDTRLFSEFHVSTELTEVTFEVIDSKGRIVAPINTTYDVCPAYDRVFMTLLSGSTPLKYEVFFHMVGDRPDVDFVRIEIESPIGAPYLYIDDSDYISAMNSDRLYRDILKSPLKDCIARYVHACKATPIQTFEGGYEPSDIMPSEEAGITAGASLLSKYLSAHDGEARSYIDYVLRMDGEKAKMREIAAEVKDVKEVQLVEIANNPFA